jgi:hypothetical protein
MTQTEPKTTQTEQKTTYAGPKTTDMRRQIAELAGQSAAQLRARYLEVFGEAPRCHHRDLLIRRIAWRLQALAEGDLSERARRRAQELARDADVRMIPPANWRVADAQTAAVDRDARLPEPGSLLTREFRGRIVTVEVLEDGFRHEGVVHPSLSAVARHATGTQWNGFLFFRLNGERKRRR